MNRKHISVLAVVAAGAALSGAIFVNNTDAPTSSAATLLPPTKVAVFMEENHSYSQMKAGMPNLAALANKYSYATNWSAITHPSLPNYLAIVGGSTFGVTTNDVPAINAPKVKSALSAFDVALAGGSTAKMYIESMAKNCGLTNSSGYVTKHNPWPYFGVSVARTNCGKYDVPLTTLATDTTSNSLPNLSMIVPNQAHDAHNGTLGAADTWLKPKLAAMLASTDFISGRLVIVVTADEDDKKSGNKVFTVVMNAGLNGKVVTTALTHYSLTRYFSQITGTTPVLAGKSAPDMKAAFGL